MSLVWVNASRSWGARALVKCGFVHVLPDYLGLQHKVQDYKMPQTNDTTFANSQINLNARITHIRFKFIPLDV